MAKLKLSFACALYDRMQPLYTGEVEPDGIELNFMPIEEPRPIFDRMSGGQEFDVAEYSSSEFVQRFANKQCPFVALPVFPSRAFRHGFIAINKQAPHGNAAKLFTDYFLGAEVQRMVGDTGEYVFHPEVDHKFKKDVRDDQIVTMKLPTNDEMESWGRKFREIFR